jgi:hypothetical protein
MFRARKVGGWAILVCVGAAIPVRPARADNAPAISVSGFLDLYYQYDFNRPIVGTSVAGRQFDIKHNSFSLALAEVNAVKAPGNGSQVGFTVTGTVGKNADLLHATEPGGVDTYKYLQQAYVTYLTKSKTPATVDFGKFTSWCGYEVPDSPSNDNYSRSFLFTLGEPAYHTGVRFGAPLTSKLTGTAYIVNGWSDSGKTGGATLAYAPSAKLTITGNWMGGHEGGNAVNPAGSYGGIGFATPGTRDVQMADLIAVYQPTPKLKLAANADYTNAANGQGNGGHWSGEALYGRMQMSAKNAAALRIEHFEDTNGLRTGTPVTLHSVTATYEMTPEPSLLSRVELRYDASNNDFFPGHDGAPRKNQTTLTIAQVVKF